MFLLDIYLDVAIRSYPLPFVPRRFPKGTAKVVAGLLNSVSTLFCYVIVGYPSFLFDYIRPRFLDSLNAGFEKLEVMAKNDFMGMVSSLEVQSYKPS